MDQDSPPWQPVPPADPVPPPAAEPELGAALQLLVAALTVLLRRAFQRTAMLLRAGSHRATALAPIMRPLVTRYRGAAMRHLPVWRAWVRRSVLAASAAPGGSPLPAAEDAAGGPAAPSLPPPSLPPSSLPSGASVGAAPPRRRRFRLLRAVFWTASATLLPLAIFLGYCLYTLPLARKNPAAAAPAALVLEADNGQPFATRGVYKGQWVPANQLPGDFVHAVVAIEDRRFFQHPGVDFWGIARAAVADLLSGSVQQGGNTITQQLVRMSYLSPQRTIVRKLQEALLAIWLEHRLSKFEILTRYVNTAYYGAGAYGIDAAAERYFGKPAQALDLAESAMLAGLINAPSELAPTINLAGARERADAVLHAMVEEDYISPAQAAAARAHPARLIVPPATEPGRNYFADTAQTEVRSLIGVPLSNLTVKTTLDPALQDLAERVVDRWLARDGKKRHIGQAALVALAPDGAVLAMVGGRNYDKSQFNRVTQALRQPGSLFKIFVYLAALDAGYTPDSILLDQPVQIGDWRPKDYERHYRGPVTLKTAFADSINTVSAQLVQKIGVQKVIAMARRLGIATPLPAVPSLALGTADVNLLEMTQAMDTIATDTKSVKPYTVATISVPNPTRPATPKGGNTPLYTHPEPQAERPSWHWHEMMDLLQAVVQQGTGRAARLDRPVGGKTGTTNDYRDAWFVGFTTDFVVGVWCGNDDDAPMKGVTGGDVPAKIWHDFVAGAERIEGQQTTATAPSAMPVAADEQLPAAVPGQTAPASAFARQSAAAAPDTAAPPPSSNSAALPPPDMSSDRAVTGIPLVIDTATLMFKGRLVRLAGVEGEAGSSAAEMAQFIAGRPVTCAPIAPAADTYRCRLGDYDLARVVLYNGGGRAAPDASVALKLAEEQAREAGRGLWER